MLAAAINPHQQRFSVIGIKPQCAVGQRHLQAAVQIEYGGCLAPVDGKGDMVPLAVVQRGAADEPLRQSEAGTAVGYFRRDPVAEEKELIPTLTAAAASFGN